MIIYLSSLDTKEGVKNNKILSYFFKGGLGKIFVISGYIPNQRTLTNRSYNRKGFDNCSLKST